MSEQPVVPNRDEVRLATGRCPKCGTIPESHADPEQTYCDLTPEEVTEQVTAYREAKAAERGQE